MGVLRLFTLMFLVFTFVPLYGQVVLQGGGLTGNPKLYFRGKGGPGEQKLLRTLYACGWFDLVSSPKAAEYILSSQISPDGKNVTLHLSNGADVKMFQATGTHTNRDFAIYTAVDAVLSRLFGIKGICRSKIAFTAEVGRGRKDIYMCDIDGSNLTRVTKNNSLSIEPVWHPSGRAILFNQYLYSSSPLVEYDISNNRSRVLSAQRGINQGRVSHDGKRIALVVTVGNQVDLFVRNYEGGNLIRLTNDRANEASPSWSPDDSMLCYVSDRTGRPKLYIISSRGGRPQRVKGTAGSECVSPNWGNDNRLAYTAKVGGYSLRVLDLTRTMGFPLPPGVKKDPVPAEKPAAAPSGESPSWAPDNRHIVLSSRGKILIVDTRTNRTRVLMQGSSRCSGGNWSPLLP